MSLNISSLSYSRLQKQLARDGIIFPVGPFAIQLKSKVTRVAQGIHKLYADYPLFDKDHWIDFRIQIRQPNNIRRWFQPQILFELDYFQPFKPLPLSQAFPFFEWGLNWVVAQNATQYLITHSAVVEKNGFAAILPAPPGSGKSTLCAALILNGWRLLSDEMGLISMATGLVHPIPRPVSLKNESIELIRQYSSQACLGDIARDTSKGDIAHLKASAQAIENNTPVKPRWVILPRYQADSEALLEPMEKASGFMQLIDNGFNYSLQGEAGFRRATQVIDQCDCYQFSYSRLDDAISVFEQLAAEVRT